jgi:hypothetical protein
LTHLTPETDPPAETLVLTDPADPSFATPVFSELPVDELVGRIVDDRLGPLLAELRRLRPPATDPSSGVVAMILRDAPLQTTTTRKPTNGGRPFADWSPVFLQVLSETSNVRAACRVAGVSRQTAYTHRRDNKRFAELWDLACQDGDDLLEGVARDMAIIERNPQMVQFLLRVRRYPSSTMIAARATAADGSSALVEIGPYDEYKNRLVALLSTGDDPDESDPVFNEP